MTIQEYDPRQDQLNNKHHHVSHIAQLPQQRFIYLLIDGASIKALPLIYTRNQQPEFEVLYHSTKFQEMLDISPVIVRFDNNSELHKHYDRWQNHAVAFTSTADLKTTADHLRSLLLCRMPNTQPAFFRFYAHDWLYPLITEQPKETLYNFTGPIDQWFIPQADKTWQALTIAQQGEAKTVQDECWFTLTQDLLAKLSEYNYQQFIDQITAKYTLAEQSSPIWQALRDNISCHAKDAENYGLEEKGDITTYIDLALQYPDEIHSPPAKNILQTPATLAHSRLNMLKDYFTDFMNRGI